MSGKPDSKTTQKPSRAVLGAIWLAPTACLLALTAWVYSAYHIDTAAPLGDEAKSAVMVALRSAMTDGLDSAEPLPEPAHPELARPLANRGPAVVRVWYGGRQMARIQAHGPRIVDALRDAARQLASHERLVRLLPAERLEARIQVDIVTGRGRFSQTGGLLRSLGLHPGLEGLGAAIADRGETLLLPDELTLANLHGKDKPLPFIPDFTIGLDFDRAEKALARHAKMAINAYRETARSYFRIRTQSVVERPAGQRDLGPPLTLVRGLPPGPEVTAEALRAGALAGGRYLVAHLTPTGRYIYRRNLSNGSSSNPRSGPYSLPRHAGTTYYLAELYRYTGQSWLLEPTERAFAHLQELVEAGGCRQTLPSGVEIDCVLDRGRRVAELGSTALTVVALVEYQRATGDLRYRDLAARLTEWILWMQRPDGSFAHFYDVVMGRKDEHRENLYYSGEAALALARMHEVTGEARYRDATERALDDLVAWYDFFVGGFFYGEEHWTCIAAEAAYPALDKLRYLEFCEGFAEFLRRQQPGAGDFLDQPDYVGSYNATAVIVPQNTPAGSRTEAVISTYQLGLHHGRRNPAILDQIRLTLGYVLRQQIRPENDFAVSARARGIGAVPGTPVDRSVRIDYVQHVGSAMIRAVDAID